MKTIIIFSLLFSACYARPPFPDQTDDKFQNDCLTATNNYRAKHHAPALAINNAIVTYAKSRCNLTSQYEGLSNGHTGLQGYGENLFWSGNSQAVYSTCSQAVDSWYNEVKSYNYNSPGFSSATGHFTQLVWKSTTSVGCARCGGKGGSWYETYVVCDYSPAGNVVNAGFFEKNVLKP